VDCGVKFSLNSTPNHSNTKEISVWLKSKILVTRRATFWLAQPGKLVGACAGEARQAYLRIQTFP